MEKIEAIEQEIKEIEADIEAKEERKKKLKKALKQLYIQKARTEEILEAVAK